MFYDLSKVDGQFLHKQSVNKHGVYIHNEVVTPTTTSDIER